ncbi:hypothetical protein [Aeromonas phage AS-sw]|uniref:Uncharacterized protein n=1 Tax=Aeromonas phage AS-sw TaxID=2026113 RepID=A0A291LGB5_9CAUD|nr:hypothetical protein HWB29_gp075 [Aeromonas phage AS-sw]ATI18125.1 hypothetical protein [Aeromonas phage AS-sw]QMV29094.1 hypothetical protein AP1_0387 [Aeromonas phage AP1]
MKNIREIAAEMKTLLNSRGYGITSVFGMYLDNNAMMVIKGRELEKVARDFALVRGIHSIVIAEELCYDSVDFEDPTSEAELVRVLKCCIDYVE